MTRMIEVPFGTTRRCRILDVIDMEDRLILVAAPEDDTTSTTADIIIYGKNFVVAFVGDTGTLEFRRGGPFGGYWHFTRDA